MNRNYSQFMNRVNHNSSIGKRMALVTRFPRKMPKRTDKLTDAVLRRIEELRVQHGAPGSPMKQKTLARRSGQTYARVHKFLSGQMPYPPLDFLDALLQSFGLTLADVLKGQAEAPKRLPILREDVQRVADMLDDAPADLVESARGWIALFLKGQAVAEQSDLPAQGHAPAKPKATAGTAGKRGTRGR
jgi:transcriptional regulator with XRE-family HTH domain